MKIEHYSDADVLAVDVAKAIADDLGEALKGDGRAVMAVPGGTTPGPIFDALSSYDLDWTRVDVILTDERWVPADHERSNTRLVKERLLVNKASAARILPMYSEAEEPEEKLSELETYVAPNLPIAVAVLGMGADMHTASLFPDSAELQAALAADAPILVPVRPASQPEARITLSARVLNAATKKHVVFKGKDKMDALETAQTLTPSEAPIRAVIDGATVHWTES